VKRRLSHEQEQVIRLCHHDHQGLSIESAAIKMGVLAKDVRQLLRSAKRIAPQLFPILTPQHRTILMMYDQHQSGKAVAAALDITLPVLKRRVKFLWKHGFLRNRKVKRYQPHMDSQVKQRF